MYVYRLTVCLFVVSEHLCLPLLRGMSTSRLVSLQTSQVTVSSPSPPLSPLSYSRVLFSSSVSFPFSYSCSLLFFRILPLHPSASYALLFLFSIALHPHLLSTLFLLFSHLCHPSGSSKSAAEQRSSLLSLNGFTRKYTPIGISSLAANPITSAPQTPQRVTPSPRLSVPLISGGSGSGAICQFVRFSSAVRSFRVSDSVIVAEMVSEGKLVRDKRDRESIE